MTDAAIVVSVAGGVFLACHIQTDSAQLSLTPVKPAIVHAELKVKQMEHEERITTWRNKDLTLVLIMWK
ncbi:hypothetical protein AA471_27205 [Salmonella enterica subsp. enterica]|nr:hypothetical protein [Salmonella enterica subsp. enterica]ECI0980910.1 hypothetical protein [Salmonella enterica subsp. enterica serovar Newport]ECO0902278.1 hypothetical protein [Salmonella enterica subsp. enterica serovar Newport]ECO1013806.1 hypothetical protein [Salmonella enterica subsp. enterica serovar Newport]EDQ2991788.1 hypothetical protein [Salmonella enterica subsp. enterica]